MKISIHKCSFGQVLIGTDEKRIKAVELGKDSDECYRNFINRWSGISQEVTEQTNSNLTDKVIQVIDTGVYDPYLEMYLYGSGTYFQAKVWEVIRNIEPGQTLSYKDIATQVGHPKAVRAVGSACKLNPIAILVPCHRVIRSDGGDGGYRWGLDIKQKLLQREAVANNGI